MTTDTDDAHPRWAAADLLRRCKERFKQGWRDLPDGAARRWTWTVAIGFVLSLAATVGMTWAAKGLSAPPARSQSTVACCAGSATSSRASPPTG